MIRFEQVAKRYPNGHVGLHELSFRVRRGEFLFVTGHSGAGKSTMLRLLLAMERPSAGKLLLAGQDLAKITNAQIPFLRRQIGVVFQNHQLLFDRSVFANVALPLQILGLPQDEINLRVSLALERVSLKDKALQAPCGLIHWPAATCGDCSGNCPSASALCSPMSLPATLIRVLPQKSCQCLKTLINSAPRC